MGVRVQAPNGDIYEMDEADVPLALKAGGKLEESAIPSKYDSPLKAGLAGAARALTFGASDPLMRYGFNVQPETLQGLKEENPIASTVGEVGGIAASLASGVGAPSAIAKVGNLARGAVAARNAGLLARLGSHAVAGMAEGGLYGLSQYISDTGLEENPNLSAEKLFASVGGGALTGGIMGGAGGAVVEGVSAAKNMVASRLNGLTLREGLKKLAAKGLVRNVAQMSDYAHGALDDANEIGAYALKNAELPQRADPYRMAEKFGVLKENIGNERMGPILKQADDAAPKGFDMVKAVEKGRALANEMRKSPLAEPIVKAYDDVMDGYLKKAQEGGWSFKEAFKEQSDILKNTPEGPLKGRADLLYKWRNVLLDEVRNQAEVVVPDAANALKAASRDYRSAYQLESLSGKAANRLEAKSPFTPAYWIQRYGGGLSAHMLNELGDSAAVHAMSNGLKKSIDTMLAAAPLWGGVFRGELELASARGAMNLLETHVKLAESDPNYLAAVGHVDEPPATLKNLAARSAQLERARQVLDAQETQRNAAFDALLKKGPVGDKKQLSLKGYKTLSALYNDAVGNPQVLADLARPEGIDEVAPDLAAQVAGVSARAVNYLQAVMPKPPEIPGMKALDRGWEPSDLELSRWARCIKAVQDPNSVLRSPTKQGIEALQVVYPELYADTKNALMERLASHKGLLDMQQRTLLAQIVGSPLGGVGNNSRLILAQNLYNTQKMKKPAAGGPDGRQHVSQEENAQTQAQRIEGR